MAKANVATATRNKVAFKKDTPKEGTELLFIGGRSDGTGVLGTQEVGPVDVQKVESRQKADGNWTSEGSIIMWKNSGDRAYVKASVLNGAGLLVEQKDALVFGTDALGYDSVAKKLHV